MENDTIQYDASQHGQFIPEQKTDYIFTTTSVEEDFIAAIISHYAVVGFTIINFILLIVVLRKLKRIEKKIK